MRRYLTVPAVALASAACPASALAATGAGLTTPMAASLVAWIPLILVVGLLAMLLLRHRRRTLYSVDQSSPAGPGYQSLRRSRGNRASLVEDYDTDADDFGEPDELLENEPDANPAPEADGFVGSGLYGDNLEPDPDDDPDNGRGPVEPAATSLPVTNSVDRSVGAQTHTAPDGNGASANSNREWLHASEAPTADPANAVSGSDTPSSGGDSSSNSD